MMQVTSPPNHCLRVRDEVGQSVAVGAGNVVEAESRPALVVKYVTAAQETACLSAESPLPTPKIRYMEGREISSS